SGARFARPSCAHLNTASVPARDPLALGLGSLAAGLGVGAACVTLATIGVVIMGAADVRGDALIAGLAVGIAVAAVTSWRLSRPLDNLWQRGVVSVLAVFGALITALVLTTLVHRMLGLL